MSRAFVLPAVVAWYAASSTVREGMEHARWFEASNIEGKNVPYISSTSYHR